MIKKILQKLLYIFSRLILKKYKPRIIAITGSVGKTSTREAVFCVLKNHFKTRCSQENYNNEIGIPLTIINAQTQGRSIIKWTSVFLKALRLIVLPCRKYPDILVLEMAADRKGDIEYLTQLAPPDIGVITNVSESHLKYFKTLKRTAREKEKLIKALSSTGYAVLNFDDERVKKMQTSAHFLTYGLSKEAQVRALEVAQEFKDDKAPLFSFKLNPE